MSQIIDLKNPRDLNNVYDKIELQRGVLSDGSDMVNLDINITIDITTANDLSTGYTTYTDETGTTSNYYRYRYKRSSDSAVSDYSDVFQGGTTILHTKFRRRLRDVNSSNYFFTDDDVSMLLSDSIAKLFPHTYNEVIDESLSTSSSTRKYSFPIGVHRVNDIEYVDSSGDVAGYPVGYKIRAKQIIFDSPPPSGYTMRLYCDKMFRKLAEVPDFFYDLLLDLMCLGAFEVFESDRHKYYKYTTVANPEGGNLPSLRSVIERLQITTKDRLNSLRRVRRPGRIKTV